MKYHIGQCEICKYSKPKPLPCFFVCSAYTGEIYQSDKHISKKNISKKYCWFSDVSKKEFRKILDKRKIILSQS